METYYSKPLDRLNPEKIEWVPIADGVLHLPPDLEKEIHETARKLAEAEARIDEMEQGLKNLLAAAKWMFGELREDFPLREKCAVTIKKAEQRIEVEP